MKKLAIIDDREEVGRGLLKPFKRFIKAHNLKIEVVFHMPLPRLDRYVPWMISEDIVGIIADENLLEQYISGSDRYNGHDLAAYLRSVNSQIPVYIVTSYPETESLINNKGDFEDFIKRIEFSSDETAKPFLDRIFRATQIYVEHYEEDYNNLGKLAEKLALGLITDKERVELNALKAKLSFGDSIQILNKKEMWYSSTLKKVKNLEELADKFEEKFGIDQ
ncbi:MAG: hypothetical protein AAF433_14800 [Bacteroidota bacterium]